MINVAKKWMNEKKYSHIKIDGSIMYVISDFI
jgi:hypothetical protein